MTIVAGRDRMIIVSRSTVETVDTAAMGCARGTRW